MAVPKPFFLPVSAKLYHHSHQSGFLWPQSSYSGRTGFLAQGCRELTHPYQPLLPTPRLSATGNRSWGVRPLSGRQSIIASPLAAPKSIFARPNPDRALCPIGRSLPERGQVWPPVYHASSSRVMECVSPAKAHPAIIPMAPERYAILSGNLGLQPIAATVS